MSTYIVVQGRFLNTHFHCTKCRIVEGVETVPVVVTNPTNDWIVVFRNPLLLPDSTVDLSHNPLTYKVN